MGERWNDEEYTARQQSDDELVENELLNNSAEEEEEEEEKGRVGFPVVGIGMSAGGMEALKQFLGAISVPSGMAYVVVQHLFPEDEIDLKRLVGQMTGMKVFKIADGMEAARDTVYVIPAGAILSIEGGKFRLSPPETPNRQPLAIDIFYRSLAEDAGSLGVCVLLSGTGTDGAVGLAAVKEHGGLVFAQEPREAAYDNMPRYAISTGLVDVVAPAADLGARLLDIQHEGWLLDDPDERGPYELLKRRGIEVVLEVLNRHYGNRFSDYKPTSLRRRIGRRMQLHGFDDIDAYVAYLEEHDEEVEGLYFDLLISVTNFLRDPGVWKSAEETVVPQLFERTSGRPIRVWVAGCATGEEAYSVAMLLDSYAREHGLDPDFKIFGTDINERVIQTARQGLYPAQSVLDIPEGWIKRYFHAEGHGYRVCRRLRNRIVFAPQNLLTDPPFADLDLITCRNVMIYLNEEAQRNLLESFHSALDGQGYLVLGASEMLGRADYLYQSVDPLHRIFRALPDVQPDRESPLWPGRASESKADGPQKTRTTDRVARRHQRALLGWHAPASVLVDERYRIRHIHGDVGEVLRVAQGRPDWDILAMLSPELRPDVRAGLYQVFETDCHEVLRRIYTRKGGEERLVDLSIRRMEEPGLASIGFAIDDRDGDEDEYRSVASDRPSDHLIAQLEEQLEATRRRLNLTIEEYETSSEELKAANDELQAMNEELQMATEAVDAKNEQLLSINEELETVNAELSSKIDELDKVNSDLQNLMASTEIGAVFLDRSLRIKRYTPPATEYLNVIHTDIDRPFAHVTHRFEYDGFVEDARRVLETLEVVEREVSCEEGRQYLLRFRPYRTVDHRVDGVVLTFIEITDRKQYEQALLEAKEQAEELAELRSVFLSTMSHEVRSPLTAILTYAELLAKRVDGEEAEKVDRIKMAGGRVRDSLDSVLRISQLESGRVRPNVAEFNIADLLRGSCKLHQEWADQEGLTLKTKGLEEPIQVCLDSKFVGQIVNNLLDNALKYTQEGEVELELEARAETIHLSVSDTGVGIAANEQKQIFRAYEQTDSARDSGVGGVGLGLAITSNLVESMGGRIRLESVPGEGSCFTVTLPRYCGPEDIPAGGPNAEQLLTSR